MKGWSLSYAPWNTHLCSRCGGYSTSTWDRHIPVKFDIESAYRMVPVHPISRPLLCIKWKENVYVDKALPFGLRSAPKIFTAVTAAMHGLLDQQGLEMLHHLDDLMFRGLIQGSSNHRSTGVPGVKDSHWGAQDRGPSNYLYPFRY